MITQLVLDAINENIPEDEHPFMNGFVNGIVDGSFLYGSALTIIGFGLIVSNKIFKVTN